MTDSANFVQTEEYDAELERSSTAMRSLKEYISNYEDGIILAGPPSLKGSLAHFYKEHLTESSVIKACEYNQYKAGIHSFVQKYQDVFSFRGKGAKKHVVLFANTSRPKLPREPMVAQSRQTRAPEVTQSRKTQISDIRGTIRSIEVLLKELTEQTDKLSI